MSSTNNKSTLQLLFARGRLESSHALRDISENGEKHGSIRLYYTGEKEQKKKTELTSMTCDNDVIVAAAAAAALEVVDAEETEAAAAAAAGSSASPESCSMPSSSADWHSPSSTKSRK